MVRRIDLLMLLLAVGCGVIGCGGSNPGSPEDGGLCECYGGDYTCWDNAITMSEHAWLTCEEYWNGFCPYVAAHECALGCRYEGAHVHALDHYDSGDASFLCEGAPNAVPGSRCIEDGDCLPSQAEITTDGTVINQYLACDWDTQSCYEVPPPHVNDYLGDCGTIPTVEASAVGWIRGSSCYACLVVDDPTAGCVWTGCTTICFGDHQCPPGSICDATLPDLNPGDDQEWAVCKPGPPRVYGQDLQQCI